MKRTQDPSSHTCDPHLSTFQQSNLASFTIVSNLCRQFRESRPLVISIHIQHGRHLYTARTGVLALPTKTQRLTRVIVQDPVLLTNYARSVW